MLPRRKDFHNRNKCDQKKITETLYYQPKKLECHLNKAIYKMALDSVNKIFHGLKNALEKNEELPNDFSETFLLHCFLNGKSKGGFFDKIRSKLPKFLLGTENDRS